jgi:hypothetical protein
VSAYKTEAFLFDKLREFYPEREFALLPQVGNATGGRTSRHLDAVALGLWPSRGIHLHGLEIKCDYYDWRRELATPEKAEAIARYCSYFWLVASDPQTVPVEELPENWGLYTWNAEKEILELTKRATLRADVSQPTWDFVAALLRKAQECVGPESEIARAHAQGVEAGKAEAARAHEWELRHAKELREKVAEFQKASGVDLDYGWQGAEKIGAAVKTVLEGSIEQHRAQLVGLAKGILRDLNEPEDPPTTRRKKKP